ncbi:MAG TPA: hypothetical protein DD435_02780 [Cyanobacteria bacterium UBA8530]|nr:hypothetical protein [Cyanobacteria bacterium UBA8530]
MKKRWMLLCGLLMAGCTVAPNSSVTTPTGSMRLGLVGEGYSVQSILAQPNWVFGAIRFKPTKIEIHYAGAIPQGEALPADIKGLVADQSAVNVSDELDSDPTSNDGQWLSIPLADGPVRDLTKLGDLPVSLGEGLFKTGRYDKIRLTGGGDYEAMDGTTPQNGNYVLPSGRLYLNQGFEIREGYQTSLAFSFNAGQAMVNAGAKVILKPTSVKVFAKYAPIEPEPTASPSVSPEASPNP